MFGSEPSVAAQESLILFKKKNIKNIVELGAGLGRDTIFFAKNSIHVQALDYSPSAIKKINEKAKKDSLSNFIYALTSFKSVIDRPSPRILNNIATFCKPDSLFISVIIY